MAAVTICSNFGAQENKVSHCFPIYVPWSDGTRCHIYWLPSIYLPILSAHHMWPASQPPLSPLPHADALFTPLWISHPVPGHFLHGCSPTLHGFGCPRWLPLHRHTLSLPLISDSTRQATPCHTVAAWRVAHQKKKKKYIYLYIYIYTNTHTYMNIANLRIWHFQ